MRLRRLAIVSAVLLGSTSAQAQTEAAIREAENRFNEGVELYTAGKIEEARLKYTQAHAVLKNSRTLWNLAVSEAFSKRPLEAIRHLREYLKLPSPNPVHVASARERYIPDLEKQTARVRVEAPGALKVSVDGEPLRDHDTILDVMPGVHRVEVTTPQGVERREASCGLGETVTVRVVVATTAQTKGDGDKTPTDDSPARWVVPTALGVAGLAAIGAGIGFRVAASGKGDEAETARHSQTCGGSAPSPECAKALSLAGDEQTDKNVATGLWITGGALAIGALVTYLVWPKSEARSAGAHVAPLRLGSGAVVLGRF